MFVFLLQHPVVAVLLYACASLIQFVPLRQLFAFRLFSAHSNLTWLTAAVSGMYN